MKQMKLPKEKKQNAEMKDKIGIGILALLLMVFCSGIYVSIQSEKSQERYGTENERQSIENVEATDEKNDLYIQDKLVSTLQDNAALYEQEDTEVVTMYLTVSQGNSSENTNHTWNEINSHSVYYYEENEMERSQVEGLLQVGDEQGPLEGMLGYGQNIPNATVSIRGQTSSEETQKSYKIKMKDEKGTWNNQQVINLNKHVNDGVRFRNALMYRLMQDVPGMIRLETQFVHLYVKDNTQGVGKFEDYGLYTQVEQPNKSFLKRHGLDQFGQLYKLNYFEFYQYEDAIKLTSDAEFDQERFDYYLESKGNSDHSKLIAMLADVNDYSLTTKEVLDKWFDTENLYTWLAFQILTGNIDTQSRNTLLYSPLNINTFYFISWDNDGALLKTEYELLQKNVSGSWETGVSNYWGNVLIQRILKDTEQRSIFDQKVKEVKEILNAQRVEEYVERYQEITQQFRGQEPDLINNPLNLAQYKEVCAAMPDEIEQNYNSYLQSLQKPMPFFIGDVKAADEGYLFAWESSYDFNQDDVEYTITLADNLEMKEPIMEGKTNYLQYAYEKTLVPGQYFIQVKAKNEAGESQNAFDYYIDSEKNKHYGIKCFYVFEDGSIQEGDS